MFKEIGNLLPTLRRLLSVDLGEASRAEVVDILRTFIGLCQLSVEEAEPHTQNQKILYNFGQCMTSTPLDQFSWGVVST